MVYTALLVPRAEDEHQRWCYRDRGPLQETPTKSTTGKLTHILSSLPCNRDIITMSLLTLHVKY